LACRKGGSCRGYASAQKEKLTMEWQPIETAPRDKTPVLGYADGQTMMIEGQSKGKPRYVLIGGNKIQAFK